MVLWVILVLCLHSSTRCLPHRCPRETAVFLEIVQLSSETRLSRLLKLMHDSSDSTLRNFCYQSEIFRFRENRATQVTFPAGSGQHRATKPPFMILQILFVLFWPRWLWRWMAAIVIAADLGGIGAIECFMTWLIISVGLLPRDMFTLLWADGVLIVGEMFHWFWNCLKICMQICFLYERNV